MSLPFSPAATYTFVAAGLAAAAAYLLFHPTPLVQWLQKKNYQYEVSSSLYMLTPTEKFVFNSIAFLTLSLFTLAITLYLPDHLATISRRSYYYFVGAGSSASANVNADKAVIQMGTTATEAVVSAATELARGAYAAAAESGAAAGETAERLGLGASG